VDGSRSPHRADRQQRGLDLMRKPQTELGLWVSLVVGTFVALCAFVGFVIGFHYLWRFL